MSAATLSRTGCGCGTGSGEYLVVGTDDRLRVTDTTAAPFRYICDLEDGGWSVCSGTLIGPRTVLTAGHCLVGSAPANMRVIPGRRGSLEPLPATQATRFLVYPGFAEATRTDIGLVHLRDPIGRTVGFWTRRPTRTRRDPVGTSISVGGLPMAPGALPVNVSGYPGDLPSDPALRCRDATNLPCRYSPLRPPRNRTECGTYQYRSFDKTVRLASGLLEYLDDTCGGHSGSPVWVRRDPALGGRVLVGVHVGAPSGAPPNAAVRLTPAHMRWITANTI
jgi:V8-like Glu-specific endopeptidase